MLSIGDWVTAPAGGIPRGGIQRRNAGLNARRVETDEAGEAK